MLFNIIIGFIIPWFFGIILYFKDKKIILIIAPFATLIAYTINEFGFHMQYWRFAPINVPDDLTTMSTNLGLYPIITCYLIYLISRKRFSPHLFIMIFTVVTTLLEYLMVLFNLVIWKNGWNIGWTFLSYLIAYLLVYCYYSKLRKMKIFESPK